MQLDLKYAAETNALEPPHKYVPWVVVDGQPLYEVCSLDYQINWSLYSTPASFYCSQDNRWAQLLVHYSNVWFWTMSMLMVFNKRMLYLWLQDYENYISYVCKAYKGALPKACSGLSFNQIYGKKFIHPVCYKEIPAPTLSSRTVSTVMSWIEKMATSM